MKKIFLAAAYACIVFTFNEKVFGQKDTTMITYTCGLNLEAQKENLGEIIGNSGNKNIYYVDLFYTRETVRTKIRGDDTNPFIQLIKDIIYTQGASTMFTLDAKRYMAFEINNPSLKMELSGKTKKILGYRCEEWMTELPNSKIEYWITDELGINISPTGNIGCTGTVLEFGSSNGTHYIATKISKSSYNKDDFEIPVNYNIMKAGKSFSQIESERVSWKNKILPDFKIKDIDGNLVSADSLKGKIAVINFWYIGCRPCVMEMPELNELVEKYKSKNDVVFLGFALNSTDQIKDFLTGHKFDYRIIPNAKELIKKFLVNIFPLNLIMDKNGNVKAEIIGYTGKEGERKEEISKMIDGLLNKADN